jgi:hypothetical protein
MYTSVPMGRMEQAQIPRTGPIGRLARVMLAVIAAVSLYSIADQGGPASFRDPSNLTEPITWVLHAAMFAVFVVLTGQLAAAIAGPAAVRPWQVRALIGLAVVLVAAAGTAWTTSGALWASPLSDVVWGVDAVMLVETIVGLVLAIVLGTPGCEIGVWPELIARVRDGDTPSTRPICLLGLHFIDDWEARRHARPAREPRRPTALRASFFGYDLKTETFPEARTHRRAAGAASPPSTWSARRSANASSSGSPLRRRR